MLESPDRHSPHRPLLLTFIAVLACSSQPRALEEQTTQGNNTGAGGQANPSQPDEQVSAVAGMGPLGSGGTGSGEPVTPALPLGVGGDGQALPAPEGGVIPPSMAADAATPPSAPAAPESGPRFGLGGASRCAEGPASICEGFEGTALGVGMPAGWVADGYGNRTLTVVDDDRARGQHALRIDVAADQGAVVGMLVHDDLGALGARHFGRSFLKIQAPAPTGFVHWDAFEARGSFNGQTNMVRWASTGTNVGESAENWSWIYNVQSTDHGEFGSEGPRSVHPRDGAWMCLEWFIDAAPPEARFWYDDVEVDYLHIDTERSEIPVFESLRVGFQKFQQTGAFRVWIDEIAFADARIGCDQ